MTTHRITVDNEGMGREINPHVYYKGDSFLSYAFTSFEQTVQHLPVYDYKGNKVVNWSGEAELVWQLKLNDEWYNSVEPTAYNKDYYRQIYRIQPKEEAKPSDFETCNCGVPNHLHGTACGWQNANLIIEPETAWEKEWANKWKEAHPHIHLSHPEEPKVEQQGEGETPKTGTAVKKPIPVEFIRLETTNMAHVYKFMTGEFPYEKPLTKASDSWEEWERITINQGYYPLKTLESGEGIQRANFGDYILKGIDGECWPVKPNIFERTYDLQHQSPIQQQAGEVSAEEVLAKAHGIVPEYLNLQLGKITTGRNIDAMHEYAALKNAELQKEVERLKSALAAISKLEGGDYDGIVALNMAKKALNQYG